MNVMNDCPTLIDFHTHILPEMDDGAKDINVSKQILCMLHEQNVGTVCLTPHFYPYKENLEVFLERRLRSFSSISSLSEEIGVRFALASETFLTDYLFNLEDISKLCFTSQNGQLYLLTELPLQSDFSDRTIRRIYRLINEYNVVPILAHIERYSKLFKNPQLINELIDMGCLMQTNLSSLLSGILCKKRILRYLGDNMIQVVGTDVHNLVTRPPDYAQGINIIRKYLKEDTVHQLMENAFQIVSGNIT